MISLVSIVSSSWETLLPALSARIRSTMYTKATLCPIHMPRHVSSFLCPATRPACTIASSFLLRAFRSSSFRVPVSVAEIRAGDRNSNADIMGRFRLEMPSGEILFPPDIARWSIDHLLETGTRLKARLFLMPNSKAPVTCALRGLFTLKQ